MSGTRRRFLQLAAAVAALAAAGFAVLRVRLARSDRALARKIRSALPDLDIEDDVLTAFAKDHRRFGDRPDYAAIGHRVELHGAFLLSTNFYENGERTDRKLAYVRYYDPWASPCYNPLLRRTRT